MSETQALSAGFSGSHDTTAAGADPEGLEVAVFIARPGGGVDLDGAGGIESDHSGHERAP
jgi:hypothetical protein